MHIDQSLYSYSSTSSYPYDIAVFVPDKKIDPVYNCKCYKVNTLRVVEFIFGAHFLQVI